MRALAFFTGHMVYNLVYTWILQTTTTKEPLSNIEPFPMTIMPVHLINSKQIGFSEQLCNEQKVPCFQVWLY